jgi:hypothetical protein
MQAPATLIGFVLIVVGSTILRPIRVRYLDRASKGISIENSNEIVLRCAMWYYIYPLLGFAGTIIMGWAALHESNSVRLTIDIGVCVLCFLGGIYLSYSQWITRLTIIGGTLSYKEGSDRRVVRADEVLGYASKGFVFVIKMKSEEVIRIPATFKHSELIVAFLNQAILNK